MRCISRVVIALSLALVTLAAAFPAFAAPKPGEAPAAAVSAAPQASLQLIISPSYTFPSAVAEVPAGLENPADNRFSLLYRLTISAEEIAAVSGIAPGCAGDVTLYQSDVIAPGHGAGRLSLSPLPDGRTLPRGAYRAAMIVQPVDLATGLPASEVYRVAIRVDVLAEDLAATAEDGGALPLSLYDREDAEARYLLVASALELRERAGLDLYPDGNGFEEKDTMVVLAEARANGTLTVAGLPAGAYTAWLIRQTDGQPPVAVARVALTVPSVLSGPPRSDGVLAGDANLGCAQAVINADYLLGIAYTGPQ